MGAQLHLFHYYAEASEIGLKADTLSSGRMTKAPPPADWITIARN